MVEAFPISPLAVNAPIDWAEAGTPDSASAIAKLLSNCLICAFGVINVVSDGSRLGMRPGSTVDAPQQAVRLGIPDDNAIGVIPLERSAKSHRQVRKDARGRGHVALLDIGNRLLARLDAGQEILHVRADRRRNVGLEILLRAIFRELLELVGDIFVQRLSAA